jgi:hypothetical protein
MKSFNFHCNIKFLLSKEPVEEIISAERIEDSRGRKNYFK